MNSFKLLAVVATLLLGATAGLVSAQTLEADMRTAAGAYERKDMATAVRIWKVWARQGDPEAQTLLGAMYWSGEGVPRDHKESGAALPACRQQGLCPGAERYRLHAGLRRGCAAAR